MKHADIACQIEKIIKNETGIVISEERKIDLDIVLGSRLVFNKMTPDKYIDYLGRNYGEIIILASFFTIQETSFYRYKSHFDRLKLQIVPELMVRNAQRKSISILSAGCATGEEAYTVAMIINDLLGEDAGWKVSITATDININAIEIAREGIYSKYKLRNIDPWYIDRYFEKPNTADKKGNAKSDYNMIYRLSDRIKEMVSFRQCNLIREPFELSFLSDVDIIFCENVIIYFCYDSIQRLIDNFYRVLREGGYLFLGYSETLNLVRHKFGLSWWNESFAYRKENGAVEWSPDQMGTMEECEQPEIGLTISSIESYPELINLAIRNYKEGLMPNVAAILRQIETGSLKVDENYYMLKAEYFYDKEDFLDAANECRKSISMNPQFIDAHLLLAVIYLKLSMFESALFEIKTSLYIEPDSILANFYYSMYNLALEDSDNSTRYREIARKLLGENNGNLNSKMYPISPNTIREIREQILGLSAR
jgi:chemotaxis protein methyltransferase CheR